MLLAAGAVVLSPTPVIATTNNGADGASGTSATVNLPASIAAGDLLIIFAALSAGTSPSASGWTTFGFSKGFILAKIAGGAEGASVSVSWTTTSKSAFYSMRITGSAGGSVAACMNAVFSSGTSVSPDPINNAPGWGALNILWIAMYGTGTGATSAFPPSYTNTQYNNSSGSNAQLGVASRNLNAISEDPGAFTTNPSQTWGALSLGIKPP